jgi:catechol 2,3-dioxygenase-like lactoylglutathione lyase family enzyme
MGKICGVHHIALKPVPSLYDKTVDFYCTALGCTPVRSWGEGDSRACMISCGDNTVMEILCGEDDGSSKTGNYNHVAFAVDEVDPILEEVRQMGYQVTMEAQNLNITPEYPVRVAFFIGPVGETIELFQER